MEVALTTRVWTFYGRVFQLSRAISSAKDFAPDTRSVGAMNAPVREISQSRTAANLIHRWRSPD